MREKIIITAVAFGIFFLAAFFRFYGGNWDQNQHLHPDERFLTMVANGIAWPNSFAEYLDTQNSPLNPHNRGFGFFVYGTFPVFFTKWIAESMSLGDYNNLTLTGRQLSALFDLGTVVLVFLIAKAIKTPRGWSQNQGKNHLGSGRLNLRSHDSPEVKDPAKTSVLGFWIFPLLSMFFYTCMVLPIQLSHFYAVETYLTFFITLSFYLLIKLISNSQNYNKLTTYNLQLTTLLGISFGLAFASKITTILFLPIIGLGLLFFLLQNKRFILFFVLCSLFFVSSYFTIRLTQPYLFKTSDLFDITLNQAALDNWKQLKALADPNGGFPPAVQWIRTKPYLFPLKNMIFWGLGLSLGLLSVLGVLYFMVKLLNGYITTLRKILRKPFNHSSHLAIEDIVYNKQLIILTLMLLWIILLFAYEGIQFAKAMRYFYPIYPFLAIIASLITIQFLNYLRNKFLFSPITHAFMHLCIYALIFVYPLSFLSIYSHPHSRVAASFWIYKNIPSGKTISAEHWDDGLPLSLPIQDFIHERYNFIEFPLYGEDTKEKWKLMEGKLKQVDYVVLTSNRLYGAIMTVPEKYPVTYKYYQALFDGSLGFGKVAEFTSRPNIPIPFIKLCLTPPLAHYGFVAKKNQECSLPGISFVDDYADETFTVYDHPKVIIFKKIKPVDYYNFLFADNGIK